MHTDITYGRPIETIRHRVETDLGPFLPREALREAFEICKKSYGARMKGAYGTSAERAALDETIAEIYRTKKRLVRKEVNSTIGVPDRSTFIFNDRPEVSQADAEHEAKIQQVLAIRDTARAALRSGNNFSADSTGIAVTITDHANGETVSSIGAQRAARLHEQPGYVWPMDLANPRQVQAADEANGVPSTGFAKSRHGR